ncbi:MAG: hypothetical protein IPI69_02350 [Bacteroidales bacterium]|nr:hypothetical protein [Bacteroidales bacterium]
MRLRLTEMRTNDTPAKIGDLDAEMEILGNQLEEVNIKGMNWLQGREYRAAR